MVEGAVAVMIEGARKREGAVAGMTVGVAAGDITVAIEGEFAIEGEVAGDGKGAVEVAVVVVIEGQVEVEFALARKVEDAGEAESLLKRMSNELTR
jgi:hypothetical protein